MKIQSILKKIVLLLGFSTFSLVLFSNIRQTNQFENTITGLLMFLIILILIIPILAFRISKIEKNK